MEIAEFLLTRIAEDEEVARDALARASVYGDREVSWKWLRSTGGSTMWEPTNHDPARVLAECAAKRQLIEIDGRQAKDKGILAALALPYANHPDYRPEWAPLASV